MKYELPALPYALDALAPRISKQTLEFHWGKHHQAYVNNLNNLIQGTKFENADLETIIHEADGGIFNNAAQVWNHTFYFTSFSPNASFEPTGALAETINKSFGSLAEFKEQFTKVAGSLFGSGWAWLVKKDNGLLEVVPESNARNPLRNGLTPILTCDVWEHAYYLDYQNRRPDYVKNFWEVLDWKVIEKRF
ncbi:MAG: superoxide dismutase [Prevotellaceae bacterium]|jgi:Fe-Mn family superoxide dismutase|nr:superoxide dismutase [Prevotellaceae bacterium]